MGVKRDWICAAHGVFESSEESPFCPSGCDVVEKVFLQPPAFGSARTKNIDATLGSLSKSYGLTDLGPGAMRRKALAAEKSQEAYRNYCERRFGGMGWGNTPKGGAMNVKTHQIEGEGPGAPAAIASAGATTDQTAAGLRDNFGGVKAVISHKDPENLTLAHAKAA